MLVLRPDSDEVRPAVGACHLAPAFDGGGLWQVEARIPTAHVVLLGDSTLDNGRYLRASRGELSIGKQLRRRCSRHGWDLTMLAQDGAMLKDVSSSQVPLIPPGATHLVLSVGGNDLLDLLNHMVQAGFSTSSMREAIGEGLRAVAREYAQVVASLKELKCHIACCTVYRPNFTNLFFMSLASLCLRLHNSRLAQICAEANCSVLDLATILERPRDFANTLELNTSGGAKVVENIAAFVLDRPVLELERFREDPRILQAEEEANLAAAPLSLFAWRCCAMTSASRRTYALREVGDTGGGHVQSWSEPAAAEVPLGRPLKFSEAQESWRHG